MKVILTGSTGFIGQELVHQCLTHSSITSVVVLSRRALPANLADNNNSKLKVILNEDFTTYPESVLKELAGAEACIWSIGTNTTDLEVSRKVNLDYTLAAANAFTTHIAPQLAANGKKFCFVYLSGMVTSKNQEESLWYLQSARRLRGEVETKLVDLSKANQQVFESTIFRPGYVLRKDNIMMDTLIGWMKFVKVNELGAVMVDTAVSGCTTQFTEQDHGLRSKGQALLKGLVSK